LLACNDYGVVWTFQGGPAYLDDNITRKPWGNGAKKELGYILPGTAGSNV